MSDQITSARTRIAPSPTGDYHIGHLRTCLYDYALARQTGGQFVLRIEDTDQKRYVEGAVDRIMQVIKDYGLSWDEGPDIGGPYAPYIQTQRLDTYLPYAHKLIEEDHAYYCFCTQERLDDLRANQKLQKKVPRYDRHCLHLTKEEIDQKLKNKVPYVIRLRVPDGETITFHDRIRGEIKVKSNDIDDQVLIKSDGVPTYHFAVVVDDHLMNITHILRGEEWIISTPKQVLLYRYLGWDIPEFAHLTVLLDPSGKGKMSKRHGSVSARSFLEEGYLPEALLNFLMLLGWNPGDNREFFTLEEFVTAFSLDKLHKKSPIFDRKKLDYFNGYYIRQKDNQDLLPYFSKFIPAASPEVIKALTPLLKERITKFSELASLTRYLFEDVDYPTDLLLARGLTPLEVVEFLDKSRQVLSTLDDFSFDAIQKTLLDLIAANSWHTGKFFMAFRIAIAGATVTPPIVETLPLLGKVKTLARLELAQDKLANINTNN